MSRLPFLVLLALGGCATQPTVAPLNRSTHARIIAHRGGALEAPENTLAAVSQAHRGGADWVEVDVHLSLDGIPVIIHDHSVDRTTGTSGHVSALSAQALTSLPAGSPKSAPDVLARVRAENVIPPDFGGRFADQRIPTLDDLLALPDVRYMLELKAPSTPAAKEALVTAVLASIKAHDATARVGIASFDTALLEHARRLAPSLPRIGLVDHPSQLAPMMALEVAVLATWYGMAKDAMALTVDHKPAVWVWTVYSESRARDLEALGVDGLITDAPAAVLRALTGPATTPGS